MPTLNDLMTGIRGFGQGATAGLIQYPQAYIMANTANEQPANVTMPQQVRRGSLPRSGYYGAGDQRVVNAPKTAAMSFQQALSDLRADNENIAKESPVAWNAGNIAGGASTAYLTGGSSLPGMLASNTALGGISGYTEKESLTDAGVGSLMGLTFGAGGKLLNVGTNKLAQRFSKEFIEPIRKSMGTAGEALTDAQIAKIASTQEYSRFPTIRSAWDTAKGAVSNTWNVAKEAAAPAITGGLTGAGANLMIGEDPYKGAASGATIFLAAAKHKALADAAKNTMNWAGATAARNPGLASTVIPTATNAATLSSVPIAARMTTNSDQVQSDPNEEVIQWATGKPKSSNDAGEEIVEWK